MPRRPLRLLRLSVILLAARAAAGAPPREYLLRLRDLHSGERISVVYRRGNRYVPGALARLDAFLRDRRNGNMRHFDPHLFDLIHDLEARAGKPGAEIDVVCGYRSPSSNFLLRRLGHATARYSMHMWGKAMDLRVPGVGLRRLRAAAIALHRGGVGYYPLSGFLHVDTGPVRRW